MFRAVKFDIKEKLFNQKYAKVYGFIGFGYIQTTLDFKQFINI